MVVAVATGFMARGMLWRSAVAEVQEQELITLIKVPGTPLADEAATDG